MSKKYLFSSLNLNVKTWVEFFEDVYVFDDFDGTNLSNVLASKLNNSFSEPGYHSVALDSPLAVTSGDAT